jgi:small subunit ribosomal protein S13
VDIALTAIYGIGRYTAAQIVTDIDLDPGKKVESLAENEVSQLRDKIQEYKIEGDLRREIDQNLKRLMDISSYRGLRHRRQLPVRGQRTNTNARTRKGKARTISVGRKAKEVGRKGA